MNIETTEAHPFDTDIGRNWLRDMLRMGPVTVTFTKKDGDTRVMKCTLEESAIPEEFRPKPLAEGQAPRKRSEDSISVWDMNANGWRSFIFKNVTSVSLTVGSENADRVEGFEKPPEFA
jgi:hypothetical protein